AGTVTYSLYPTNDCSGTASTTDAEAVTSSGSVTASSLSAALTSGGDTSEVVSRGHGIYRRSLSTYEPFTVNQAATRTRSLIKAGTTTVDNPTLASTAAPTPDIYTLSLHVALPILAGTVTYSLYPTNDCSGTASTTDAEAVTSSGSVTASSLSAALAAGGYSYKAVYGDRENNPRNTSHVAPSNANHSGNNNSSLVNDGPTTVDTTTHAALGYQSHIPRPLTAPLFPYTTLFRSTYSLYPTNDCSGTASTTDAEAVTSSGSVTASSLSAALAAGGYSYKAVY